MTMITIEMSDNQARQLAEEAAQLNVTIEYLAAKRLSETISQVKPDFGQIGKEIVSENAELYRRLA